MGCCGGGGYRDMGYGSRRPHGHRDEHRDEYLEADSRQPRSSTPLEMLKERLAKGEITIDEYREISQALTT